MVHGFYQSGSQPFIYTYMYISTPQLHVHVFMHRHTFIFNPFEGCFGAGVMGVVGEDGMVGVEGVLGV